MYDFAPTTTHAATEPIRSDSLARLSDYCKRGWGYLKVRSYVIARLGALPVRPTVMLKNQPAWMSTYLAQSIANSIRPAAPSSPFDKQVLIDAYNALAINPWIEKVNEVRRVYGTSPGDRLEIDCVYRTPAALVQVDDKYMLVADDGAVSAGAILH